MKNLLWLMVIGLCLAGCAGLALSPTPEATRRASFVTGGDLSGDVTLTATLTDTLESTPDSTRIITTTDEVTITPTPTVEAEITITPTVSATVTPVADLTPISPTVTPAPVTPIGLLVDLGFRPKPNGYAFANYSSVLFTDFTTVDARAMFANDAEFCFDPNSSCSNVRLQLQLFTANVNRLIRGGHCDGITVTSLRFFEGLDRPSSLRPTATTAYSLPLFQARRTIAYYWALQLPDPVAEAQWRSTQQTPNQILTQLRQAMAGDSPDPTSLLIYNWSGKPQGHSMTPYAVEYRGGDIWRVRVYDSNWPGAENRYVEFNTAANTWSYYRGDDRRRTVASQRCGDSSAMTWCGTAQSKSLGAVPISTYTQTPLCRNLCRVPAKNGGPAHSLVSVDPDSDLLIVDDTGQRLGVIDNKPIAEIPDSFLSLLPGGLDFPAALIAHLPVSGTFTYIVSRPDATEATITTTAPSEVTIFGPGFAAVASNISVTGTDRSQLTLSADGSQLTYQSGINDQTDFKMILETADKSQALDVGNLALGTGNAITLTLDDDRGQFSLDNTQNITSTFALTYTRTTTGTERIFTATDIAIAPTDRAVVDYGGWPGSGPLTLTLTSEISGTLPRILLLNNSTDRLIYLPLILN